MCIVAERDVEQFFAFLVGDVARLIRKRFEQGVQRLNLTRAQAQVLGNINMNQGINQSELAERLDIQNMTLTRLVDKLETAGFVERRSDPNDRRMWRLYLTKAAKPILDEMWIVAEEICDDALDGLSEQARDKMIRGLSHARGQLSEQTNGVKSGEQTAAGTLRAAGGRP